MKKVVFFDFFGVISSECAPFFFRNHFSPEEADRVKSEICILGDTGAINEEEFYEKIAERTNISAEEVAKEMQGIPCINKELVEIIKQIRQKYPVYLLSNAIGTFLRRILENNNLYPLFDKVFISSEFKKAKPNKEFFEYVLRDLNIDPQDALFIDDNPANVAGAQACGIDSILFVGNEDFKKNYVSYFEKF